MVNQTPAKSPMSFILATYFLSLTAEYCSIVELRHASYSVIQATKLNHVFCTNSVYTDILVLIKLLLMIIVTRVCQNTFPYLINLNVSGQIVYLPDYKSHNHHNLEHL